MKIQTVELADGSKRYRFTVDVGRHPVTGKRQQRRIPKQNRALVHKGRLEMRIVHAATAKAGVLWLQWVESCR